MPRLTAHEAAIKTAEKRIASLEAQIEKLRIRKRLEEKFLTELKAQSVN